MKPDCVLVNKICRYGKYRGKHVTKIPADYMIWFLTTDANFRKKKVLHRVVFVEELMRRGFIRREEDLLEMKNKSC